MKSKRASGFTLIELLMVVGTAGIIIVALVMLVARVFSVSREQAEQARAGEEARTEVDRLINAIENARDVNGGWLVFAGANEMTIYTNVDDEPLPEKVRYFLEGTDFKREVVEMAGDDISGYTETGTREDLLARLVANEVYDIPVFSYTTGASGAIEAVGVRLSVDFDADKRPLPIEVIANPLPPRGPLLNRQITASQAE